MKAQIYRESLLGKYIGRWQAYIAGHIVLYNPNLFMKHSLLGWSIERPNIHSRCYSMTRTMYAYTSLLNSMQTLHSHKQMTSSVDNYTSPPQSIWSAQPRCWPRPVDKSAPHSPEPLTAIDPGQLKPNNG